ncbi:hypothetical protein [Dactylosporangium sp. NPDC051484]|uniref:hypothetical protein n=1 Tax=Dactylosporangium sp. NPDC051484 TaxID=3154942 RepID=UPI00344E8635
MSSAPVHTKATRRPGAVCGADDGPLTRLTDDPHHVTCLDCPDLAAIEAMPDDATSGTPAIIETLREARAGNWRKVDGVVLDMSTANVILAVYEATNDVGKAKLVAMPIATMAAVCWRLVGRHS